MSSVNHLTAAVFLFLFQVPISGSYFRFLFQVPISSSYSISSSYFKFVFLEVYRPVAPGDRTAGPLPAFCDISAVLLLARKQQQPLQSVVLSSLLL